jgi:hypothetical protein
MVAYRIIYPDSLEGAAGDSIDPGKQARDGRGTHIRYEYTSDVRDPFQFPREVRRAVALTRIQAKPQFQIPPPPLTLRGIVTRGKRPSAVFEDAAGTVLFLSEGDTAKGVKILQVRSPKVSYIFQKKRGTWSLE